MSPISAAIPQTDRVILVVQVVLGTGRLVISIETLRDLYCLGNLVNRCYDSCEIQCYLVREYNIVNVNQVKILQNNRVEKLGTLY